MPVPLRQPLNPPVHVPPLSLTAQLPFLRAAMLPLQPLPSFLEVGLQTARLCQRRSPSRLRTPGWQALLFPGPTG